MTHNPYDDAPAFSNLSFAGYAIRLAQKTSAWAADTMQYPPEDLAEPIKVSTVTRYLAEMRGMLDHIEKHLKSTPISEVQSKGDFSAAAQTVGQESLHTEAQAIELAPCPHCGKAPMLHENDLCEPPEWIVICECKKTDKDPAAAVAAWNRRVPTQASRIGATDDVERVARALCSSVGLDPDEELGMDRIPRWKHYRIEAGAAVAAMAPSSAAPGDVTISIDVSAEDAPAVFEAVTELLHEMGEIGTVSMCGSVLKTDTLKSATEDLRILVQKYGPIAEAASGRAISRANLLAGPVVPVVVKKSDIT